MDVGLKKKIDVIFSLSLAIIYIPKRMNMLEKIIFKVPFYFPKLSYRIQYCPAWCVL